MNQKIGIERNKKIWLIVDEDGEVIRINKIKQSFRGKISAEKKREELEKIYLKKLFLKRDNKYRDELKKLIK